MTNDRILRPLQGLKVCYIYLRSVDWGFGGVHSSRFATQAVLEGKGLPCGGPRPSSRAAADSLNPYQVKAMLYAGGNPDGHNFVNSGPAAKLSVEKFRQVRFISSHDQRRNIETSG